MTRRKLNGRNTTSPVLQHHVRPRRALAARVYGAHGCCKAFARVGGRGPVVLRTVGVAAEHRHERAERRAAFRFGARARTASWPAAAGGDSRICGTVEG